MADNNESTAQYIVYNITGGCQLYFGDAARARLCYNCRQVGHLSRNCTKVRNGDNRDRLMGGGRGNNSGGGSRWKGRSGGGSESVGRVHTNTEEVRDWSVRRSFRSSNSGERLFSQPLSRQRVRSRSRSRLFRCSVTDDTNISPVRERYTAQRPSGPMAPPKEIHGGGPSQSATNGEAVVEAPALPPANTE